MKPRRSKFVMLAVSVALAGGLQSASAGEIAGRVTDASTGRPLPSATVRIPDLNLTTRADRSGNFRLNGVPPGSYTVEVDNVGFQRSTQTVAVSDGAPAALAVAMSASGLEEVVVSGTRLAQKTALQDKKESRVIKDSVTADDAGKLPDQNAAETLVRVSGVSVTTDQGEGRYVTIRGIDASLNNVTIDNQIIGSPEGDTRRVALDTVPANLLAKLEVIKSVTPDLDGNAIGGTINILTPSAFDDPDGRFISGNVDVGYYELGGDVPWGASVAWGQLFSDDHFGVVLSASYSDRQYNTQNLQGGDPWEEEGDYLVPDEMVLRDYDIQRERLGFVANFDYRPDDDTKLYWRNIYNRYADTETQPEITYDYRNGDLIDQTPTSGTFTEGEGNRANSQRYEIQTIFSSSIGGEREFGDWTASGSYTYGFTEQDTPYDNYYEFELDDEIPMSYDTSGRFWIVEAGPEFQDSDAFEFGEAARGGQDIKEDINVFQLDLRRDGQLMDNPGYLKFGAKYVTRDLRSDQDMTVYGGWEGDDDYLLSQVAARGNQRFFADVKKGYTFGPYPSYKAAERFFKDNRALFEVDEADTVAESYGADYTVDENVLAGYLMGSVDIGSVTVIAGLRAEQTDIRFTAYDLEFVDGDIADPPPKTRGKNDYTNWLPGLQARWAIDDDLIFRAAWTNTIGRPSPEQNVPYRVFDIETVGVDVYEAEIEAGNPDLKALESANYDLALEWYLQPAGVLSAGAFYKDIKNPIFERFAELEDVDFEGRFYEELFIVQPQNAKSGYILGLELNYQQQFSMLPGLWSGLGLGLSYTWTDSEAKIFDRSKEVPFFLQSEDVANLSLYYEVKGLEMRIAYAYRSAYLDAVGESAEQDLYVDDHGQLDFKASYEFTDHFSGYLQFQNLTGEPLQFYSGSGNRLAEYEYYSWNMLAGVSMKF